MPNSRLQVTAASRPFQLVAAAPEPTRSTAARHFDVPH